MGINKFRNIQKIYKSLKNIKTFRNISKMRDKGFIPTIFYKI